MQLNYKLKGIQGCSASRRLPLGSCPDGLLQGSHQGANPIGERPLVSLPFHHVDQLRPIMMGGGHLVTTQLLFNIEYMLTRVNNVWAKTLVS